MKAKESINIATLKHDFLNMCLANQFFGVLFFTIICPFPGTTEKENPYFLTFTENGLQLLRFKSFETLYEIKLENIRKWCPHKNTDLIIEYCLDMKGKKQLLQWQFKSQLHVIQIIDYFTSLVHFLKQQKLHDKTARNTTRANKSGSSRKQSRKSEIVLISEKNNDLDTFYEDENPFTDQDNMSNTLRWFDPPKIQSAVITEIENVETVKVTEEIANELEGFYQKDHSGYDFGAIYYSPNNPSLIESGCSLLKNVMSGGSISPQVEVANWIQNNLPEDKVSQYILGWLLQSPFANTFESIGTISRIISFLFSTKLAPLDSFISLNFVYSMILRYARESWKSYDFVKLSADIDERVSSVVAAYLTVMRRVSLPFCSVLFEVLTSIQQDHESLLYLNETVSFVLQLSCISIAQALCNSGIGAKRLQPLLNSLPSISAYDPTFCLTLSNVLVPIIAKVQSSREMIHVLFDQPHVAHLQMSSLVNAVNDLSNLARILTVPISIFISTRSPRLLCDFKSTPTTIPEAAFIYQIVREAALVLYFLGERKHAALSMELCYRSTLFYNVFIETSTDPSLLGIVSYLYNDLLICFRNANRVLAESQNLESILDLQDVVHSLISSLLKTNEDQKTTLSLLALNALDSKQSLIALNDTADKLEHFLTRVHEQFGKTVANYYSDTFRVFSLTVLSHSKNNPEIITICTNLENFGSTLLSILKEDQQSDTRRVKAASLLKALKEFLHSIINAIETEESMIISVYKKVELNKIIEHTEILKKVQVPNLKPSLSMLCKLAHTLKKFQLTSF